MARDIEIAVAAADLAFKDAGLTTRATDSAAMTVPAKRLGCNIGAGLICTDLDELGQAVNTALTDGAFDIRKWGSTGMQNLNPLWLLKYLPNMLSCHVTIIHGCEGPSNCITCGDASGPQSIGESRSWIARGAADVVIAGGAESKLNPMGLVRQGLLGRLCTGDGSPAACRPFDVGHAGTVIGEGGALAILEDADHAARRGGRVYAEVVGFGGACDPDGIDVRKPTVGGMDLAVRNALRNAGITPADVGVIVAHGTGVPGDDALEAAAWRAALGEQADNIPAVAVTGATGSLFAGAGATSVTLAALALHKGVVPPTANFTKPAAGCEGLNLSANPREIKATYALTAAFGTGGQSAAVVLKTAT
jgi:3-oxoacyl-[acyl-carrier-protein] synthase II